MEIYGEVTFFVKAGTEDALQAKARELDDEEVDEYTLVQALQVVWHQDPDWLHKHVLEGWTLDKADDGDGMKQVWP